MVSVHEHVKIAVGAEIRHFMEIYVGLQSSGKRQRGSFEDNELFNDLVERILSIPEIATGLDLLEHKPKQVKPLPKTIIADAFARERTMFPIIDPNKPLPPLVWGEKE